MTEINSKIYHSLTASLLKKTNFCEIHEEDPCLQKVLKFCSMTLGSTLLCVIGMVEFVSRSVFLLIVYSMTLPLSLYSPTQNFRKRVCYQLAIGADLTWKAVRLLPRFQKKKTPVKQPLSQPLDPLPKSPLLLPSEQHLSTTIKRRLVVAFGALALYGIFSYLVPRMFWFYQVPSIPKNQLATYRENLAQCFIKVKKDNFYYDFLKKYLYLKCNNSLFKVFLADRCQFWKTQYRFLARLFHPDRWKSPLAKEAMLIANTVIKPLGNAACSP